MRALAAWAARHPVIGFFVVFAIFPWVVPYKALATQVLIYGLFALGFNLLYGYTGLLSFGHAAYWGLGAYGTGLALAKLKLASLWGALGFGLLLAGVEQQHPDDGEDGNRPDQGDQHRFVNLSFVVPTRRDGARGGSHNELRNSFRGLGPRARGPRSR